MSWSNKVLWSEGLFLRPQHFQQQDRYLEYLVGALGTALPPYPWGIKDLVIDADALSLGQVAIARARGILPDGTSFDIPLQDPAPPALQLDEEVRDQTVFLTLPIRQQGRRDIVDADQNDLLTRYQARSEKVRDTVSSVQDETDIEIGALDLRLELEQNKRSGFTHLGLTRVTECRGDAQVVIDEDYIPPCLDCRASDRLSGHLRKLSGLLNQCAEKTAARVAGSPNAGDPVTADLLHLLILNRIGPRIAHFRDLTGLHPEILYRELVGMAGELEVFRGGKRSPTFPAYRHDDLAATFKPVMESLGTCWDPIARAIRIEIIERERGYRIARLDEPELLDTARFVLAAAADMNRDELRRLFLDQIQIAPKEQIQRIVSKRLNSIGLDPLAIPPKEIPAHARYNYFELDRSSHYWPQLRQSGGFVFHIAGSFPGLSLELWAIRE